MSFDRQLDILMAVLASVLAFLGRIFSGAVSLQGSLLVGIVVFVAGLIFGRRVAEIVADIF